MAVLLGVSSPAPQPLASASPDLSCDAQLALLEGLEIGVALIGADERVCFVNPWLVRHARLEGESALGRTFEEVLGPVSHRVGGAIRRVLKSAQPAILSPALNRAPFALFDPESSDAERLHHVVHLRPIVQGGVCQCGVQVIDVSAAGRREDLLCQKASEAEDARQLQKSFLSRMSHEIRTPLNGVLALTELVMQGALDDEQRRNLLLVQESGDTLLRIVNDVLDLSKIEAGKMSLETLPSNLTQILDGIVGVLQLRAKQKGLELLLDIDSSVPPGLTIDPTRMRQVVLNLVGNAIKFTSEGQVRIDAHYRALSEGESEAQPRMKQGRVDLPTGTLCVGVTDTGIGIEAPEDLFIEYQQADVSVSRRFGGTGLGLTICKRFVELMGGCIDVQSVVGQGTRFEFHIPVTETEIRPPSRPPISIGTSTGRALVVDDNRVNRLVASKVLQRLGYQVDEACDGHEALDFVEERSFDIILMDCHMPRLDGYETTHRIRQRKGRWVPIVAVTANALPGERERCLSSGMDDYLSKPITIRAVSDVLRRFEAPPSSREAPASTLRGAGEADPS